MVTTVTQASSAVTVLEARGLTVTFGGVRALDGVDFEVADGESVGLIGPNGSGKTTLLNVVTGAIRPAAGRLRVRGVDATGTSPVAIAQRGVARVFQTVEVFPRLTVLENLLAARSHIGERLSGLLASRAAEQPTLVVTARRMLELVGLDGFERQPARALSFGQQRLLEIGMSMMSEPALLLLDEPTAGVNPGMRDRIVAALRRLNHEGTALVVVEHEVSVVFALCRRVVVLDAGRVLAAGTPAEIRADTAVAQAYLGQPTAP